MAEVVNEFPSVLPAPLMIDDSNFAAPTEPVRVKSKARPNGKTRRARAAQLERQRAREAAEAAAATGAVPRDANGRHNSVSSGVTTTTASSTGPTLEQKEADTSDQFFMHKFKCIWCPTVGQHNWQTCPYSHNYQDARRNPAIGYGPQPCPHWDKKARANNYADRCPNGVRCAFSHGAKEQLYHPDYFKTVICWDFKNNKGCPRGDLCAFYHKKKAQRKGTSRVQSADGILPEENMRALQADFDRPPFASYVDESRQSACAMPPMMMPGFPMQGGWCQPVHGMPFPQQSGPCNFQPPQHFNNNAAQQSAPSSPSKSQSGVAPPMDQNSPMMMMMPGMGMPMQMMQGPNGMMMPQMMMPPMVMNRGMGECPPMNNGMMMPGFQQQEDQEAEESDLDDLQSYDSFDSPCPRSPSRPVWPLDESTWPALPPNAYPPAPMSPMPPQQPQQMMMQQQLEMYNKPLPASSDNGATCTTDDHDQHNTTDDAVSNTESGRCSSMMD